MTYNENENAWIKFHKSGRGETLGWGLIFLWGALVALIEVTTNVEQISWWDGWAVFFLGFGLIVLTGAVVGIQLKDYTKAGWNGVIGFGAIGFGASVILNTNLFWGIFLVGIAVVLIYIALVDKKNNIESKTEWI